LGSGARRDLGRLPEKIVTAVVDFVHAALADNPIGWVMHCTSTWTGITRPRRGDYRVIYRIDAAAGAIRIVAVDHRADI